MAYLKIKQGKSKTIDVQVLDNDDQPFNLASAYLVFTVKEYLSDADSAALITKSTGDGISHTDVAGGVAQIAIEPEDTALLPRVGPRYKYYWDVQLETDTITDIVAEGQLVIEQAVRKG